MTQPAASKLLREFEDALQARLFERHARGVVPTWYGEILVRHARAILSEIGLAQEEITALRSGLSGQASIGTVLNPGTNLVPLAVGLLKQRHPRMLVSIELDYSKRLVEKLLQSELDMLVARILDSEGAEELQFEPLADERHAIIAGVQHPRAGEPDLQLQDLLEELWILPAPGSLVRDRLTAVLLARGLSLPRNIIQTTSLPVITSLLRTTNAVVPLPEEAIQPYCEAGILSVLIKDIGVDLGAFGIVTRRRQKLSPGAQLMVAALRETAAQLYSKR